jgi:hypothetical protein
MRKYYKQKASNELMPVAEHQRQMRELNTQLYSAYSRIQKLTEQHNGEEDGLGRRKETTSD